MATISITIDDALLPTVIEALCKRGRYQAEIRDPQNPGEIIPNPVTKAQFAKQVVVNYVRDAYVQYKKHEATPAVTAAVSAAKSESANKVS